jgi:hypothetical protein
MKRNFSKFTMSICTFLMVGILLSSCSKSSTVPDPSPDNLVFQPSDFSITITNKEIDPTWVRVHYDVKNLSNKNYSSEANGGNSYYIKFTVKTTDGATYNSSDRILDLDAGATFPDMTYIDYTEGKTIDLSTFKYELYVD